MRGNKTAIALERGKTARVKKKRKPVQESDGSAMAKGSDRGREDLLLVPFVRPLRMLSAPHMARLVVRLIAEMSDNESPKKH